MTASATKKTLVGAAIVALVVGALLLVIDDWGRDFVTNHAEITDEASDPALRPLTFEHSTERLVVALRGAVTRIRGWDYVGEVRDGNTTLIYFVRTSRVWRFKDDVTVSIVDLGDRRRIAGESRSRVGKGDLGQNPRNLRRILSELQAVLAGASTEP